MWALAKNKAATAYKSRCHCRINQNSHTALLAKPRSNCMQKNKMKFKKMPQVATNWWQSVRLSVLPFKCLSLHPVGQIYMRASHTMRQQVDQAGHSRRGGTLDNGHTSIFK